MRSGACFTNRQKIARGKSESTVVLFFNRSDTFHIKRFSYIDKLLAKHKIAFYICKSKWFYLACLCGYKCDKVIIGFFVQIIGKNQVLQRERFALLRRFR